MDKHDTSENDPCPKCLYLQKGGDCNSIKGYRGEKIAIAIPRLLLQQINFTNERVIYCYHTKEYSVCTGKQKLPGFLEYFNKQRITTVSSHSWKTAVRTSNSSDHWSSQLTLFRTCTPQDAASLTDHPHHKIRRVRHIALPLNFSAYQENGLQCIFSFNANRSNHYVPSLHTPEMSPNL